MLSCAFHVSHFPFVEPKIKLRIKAALLICGTRKYRHKVEHREVHDIDPDKSHAIQVDILKQEPTQSSHSQGLEQRSPAANLEIEVWLECGGTPPVLFTVTIFQLWHISELSLREFLVIIPVHGSSLVWPQEQKPQHALA